MQRERLRRITRDFWIGVSLTIVLIVCKDLFEITRPGAYLEDIARDWLEYSLVRNKDLGQPRIVVVDTSNFAPTPKHPYTSRARLQDIVEAVSSHSPRAIGVDVNFSGEDDESFFMADEDPKFLDYCLRKRNESANGLLFVGVSTSVLKGPDKCLGSKKYSPLAAYIDHPNSERVGPTGQMDEYIEAPYISDNGETQYWQCPSLAAAIAHQPLTEGPWPTKWAIENAHPVQETIADSLRIQHRRFVVDFSRIDDFESEAILVSAEPGGIAALKTDSRLSGKDLTVLIGRGASADDSDRFAVPGHSKHYAGVFLHASAAFTLEEGNRLKLMTHWGRWVFDVVVSFLIFGPILLLRLYYSRTEDKVASHRLNKILTWSALALLFFVGVSMVNKTRIFWEDFPLVMTALLLHSRLEHGIETVAPGLVRKLPSAWRRIVLTERSGVDE